MLARAVRSGPLPLCNKAQRLSDDPYVEISEKALHAMACAGNNTAYLVDQLPFLKYVPDWFPGAGFKSQAKEWNKTVSAMPQLPMDFVRRSIVSPDASGCFLSHLSSRRMGPPKTLSLLESWTACMRTEVSAPRKRRCFRMC